MPHYSVKTGAASQSQLLIAYEFIAPSDSPLIQIPYWRPGRYEGGNFAANYRNVRVFENGLEIASRKISSHVLEVDALEGAKLECRYECYSASLTAGNTYFGDDLLLINPVNSLVYAHGLEDEPCELELIFPSTFKLATGFPVVSNESGRALFRAKDIQHLLDTPILGCEHLDAFTYVQDGIEFHVHIAGEEHPQIDEMLNDFEAFTRVQLSAFGGFPVSEYHFLIILLPYKAYHGVEHENSTVIIYGDADSLKNRNSYLNLMGVSSHELYHTWNVKSLRPAEWTPYDFTGESPSRLGYVAEGVTTFLGDWMLWNSGVFSDEEFFKELTNLYGRHLLNEGRNSLSLADASVDTWVDGYSLGTPRRRISIYVEGAMLAIVCDLRMIRASEGKWGINQFMKLMYQKYGEKRGFTEADYWNEMEAFSGLDFSDLIDNVVDGTGHLETYFKEALAFVGLEIGDEASAKVWERDFGVRFAKSSADWHVLSVLSGSPGEEAGLWFGQKLLQVNDESPDAYFDANKHHDKLTLKMYDNRSQEEKELSVEASDFSWIKNYDILKSADNPLFHAWKNQVLRKKPASFQ